MKSLAVSILAAAAISTPTLAGDITLTLSTPTLDRWMYNFNGDFGAEDDATVFSPFGDPIENQFDDRDGQLLLGFSTAAAIVPGQPQTHYRIVSARVTATTSRNLVFRYDPSADPLASHYPAADPDFVADPDPDARPVELFMAGYRGGWSALSFPENGPFNNGAPFSLPAVGIRNVFTAQYNDAAALIDASNNVDARFDPRPLAVGQCPVTPGDLVPINTTFAFNIPLNTDAVRYLRAALALGRLNVVVSSLHPTVQESSATPAFYCKEFPAGIGGVPASLNLSVCIGPPGDWDCSGAKGVPDIFAFLSDWFAGAGDFNNDLSNDVPDIFDFLAAWFV